MVRISNAQKVSGWNRLATDKLVAGLLSSLLCAGCVVVVTPMPKRTTAQGRVENIDLGFIRVGHTSWAEVLEKLKAFDRGFQSNRFFLGRSSTSKWGAFVEGGGEVAAGRVWSISNLLVGFDDKGVVKNFDVFPDKFLVPKLGAVSADEKALDSSQRKELSVGSDEPAKIILYHGSFEFVKPGTAKRKPVDFTVDVAEIKSISTSMMNAGAVMDEPIAGLAYTIQVIRFTEKPTSARKLLGEKIYVLMTLPDLVVLLNFVRPRKNAPI